MAKFIVIAGLDVGSFTINKDANRAKIIIISIIKAISQVMRFCYRVVAAALISILKRFNRAHCSEFMNVKGVFGAKIFL